MLKRSASSCPTRQWATDEAQRGRSAPLGRTEPIAWASVRGVLDDGLLAASVTEVVHSHVETHGEGNQEITIHVYEDGELGTEASHDAGFGVI